MGNWNRGPGKQKAVPAVTPPTLSGGCTSGFDQSWETFFFRAEKFDIFELKRGVFVLVEGAAWGCRLELPVTGRGKPYQAR